MVRSAAQTCFWKSVPPVATGTASSYRPAGHDYNGGQRAKATGDYESWTPGA